MAISLPPSLLAAIAAAQGKAPAATSSDPSTPMGAFAALAPQVLNSQASFARPEAAAWLASMTGQQTPQWAMTPAQLEEMKKANSRSRLPAPPKRPTAQTAPTTPRPPAFFGGGMFQIPANIQALIAQYRAGQIPAQGQTSGATNTTGPAPSAFAALNRFQGPFGNGGGGLNVQSILAGLRGRIL